MYTPMMPYGYGAIPQQQTVIRVNGENGARALNIAPRSSALALDENAPIVWLITSDDAGYKTIKPYGITEYQPEPPIDMKAICDRLTKLEERMNESYPERAGNAE